MLQEVKVNHIYQGSVLEVLKEFPDNIIDCIVTSPPYYGLRSYQTTPQVWGGDVNCNHEWGIDYIKKQSGGKNGNVGNNQGDKIHFYTESNFCLKCNAWLGELGQEPTFHLYIDHLVEIFMECARVMKKEGSMWINIADSYSSGSGNANHSIFSSISKNTALSQGNHRKKEIGMQSKSLLGIPFRLATALIDRGLILRNTIIWHKRNCLPSSANDRFTNDFEYFYFFVKSPKYYFKQQFEPLKLSNRERALYGRNNKGKYILNDRKIKQTISQSNGGQILNPLGRNKRTVWTLSNKACKEAHFAVFQEELIRTPIDACCPEKICVKCGQPTIKTVNTISVPTRPNKQTKDINGEFATDRQRFMPVFNGININQCNCNAEFKPGIVLDPFMGSGTTAKVALEQNKDFIGIELNPEYIKLAEKRISKVQIRLF